MSVWIGYPQSLLPYRKVTALDVNNEQYKTLLEKDSGCICTKDHEQIIGTTVWDGKSIGRSRMAQEYPARLARHILRGALKVLRTRCGPATMHTVGVAEAVDDPDGAVVDLEDNQLSQAPSPHGFMESIRKELQKMEQDEKLRRGDVKEASSRYGFVKSGREPCAPGLHIIGQTTFEDETATCCSRGDGQGPDGFFATPGAARLNDY